MTTDTKTIVFVHGWRSNIYNHILANRFSRFLVHYLWGRADMILVLAPEFKNKLVALGLEQSKIVLTTTLFAGSIFSQVLRARDFSDIRLVFLSRFVREKGIYEVVTAFKRILSSFPRTKLILVGSGPEEPGVKRLITSYGLESSVTITGYLRGKEKAQVLRDSDIFIFPTRYGEGCPISLLEAMAAGLPVIATRVGAISTIIKYPENGILLDDPKPESIEVAVATLLNDTDLMNCIRKNNVREAWNKYEARVVTQKMEDLYVTVVGCGSYETTPRSPESTS